MKKSDIPFEYKKFLIELINNIHPISKEIMIEELSSKFNLSPDYCREVVFSIYK